MLNKALDLGVSVLEIFVLLAGTVTLLAAALTGL